MIDVVVACAYLATRMQLWVAGIVMVTVSSYVPLTVIITERRGKVMYDWQDMVSSLQWVLTLVNDAAIADWPKPVTSILLLVVILWHILAHEAADMSA